MISPAPETWLSAAPVLAVAVLLLLVPGLVALRLARADALLALGAAGPLTVSTLVVAGVLAGRLGVAWTPATLGVTVLLLWLVGALVGWLRRRRESGGGTTPVDGRLLVPALVVAAVVGAWPVMAAMGLPNSVPQQPDTIFHVGTIQSMVRAQDVSTLHAVGFTRPDATGYYPAAFHAVAATLVQLTGTHVDVAANAVALVAGAVVWPAGVALLAAVVLGRRSPGVLLAPVVSVVFTAFPSWLSGYGVLWPNLLGQALLPGALAVGLLLVRDPRRGWCWVLFPVLVLGLGAAHPNTVFGLVVLGGIALGWRLLVLTATAGRPGSRLLAGAAAAVLLVGTAAVWLGGARVATSMRASNPPGPEASWREGVRDVLLASPRSSPELWVTGALVLVGVVLTLRRARTAWVPMSWLALAGVYLALVAVDSNRTRLLTWPWFNNSPRLAGLLVVPMVLLVTAALAALAGAGRSTRPAPWRAVAVLAVFLAVTLGGNAAARAQILEFYYPAEDRQTWVSRTELEALDSLGEELPRGAVVAANPWSGGSYLALVADVQMLFPTEKTLPGDPVQKLLGKRLDQAAEDPTVCRAATDRRVGWAITGGSPATSARSARTAYAGVDGVDGAPGWEKVRTAGPYTLYRFAGCGA